MFKFSMLLTLSVLDNSGIGKKLEKAKFCSFYATYPIFLCRCVCYEIWYAFAVLFFIIGLLVKCSQVYRSSTNISKYVTYGGLSKREIKCLTREDEICRR